MVTTIKLYQNIIYTEVKTLPRRRKTKTIEVFEVLREHMDPAIAYRVTKLCLFTGYQKPALRRYLRRLSNAGLLIVYKHPEYPKRKFYALSVKGRTYSFEQPKKQIGEMKQQCTPQQPQP
jgi:DNA-binding MarR family transcriptional regulator